MRQRGARDARGGSDKPLIDIYARLSFAADGTEINVDEQIEMGRADVKARRGKVGKIFKDNSRSAWNLKVVRPEWEALMTRLEAGESDGVWVLDPTRFSRKVLEGERLVEIARQGRLVWSNAGEYSLNTADGRKAFRDAMTAAAAESDKISERVARGKRRRARRGTNPHGPKGFGVDRWTPAPPGWERGEPREWVSDEQIERERAAVRDCYDRLFGPVPVTVSALAAEFNAAGLLTSRGGLWQRDQFARMLCSPRHAGLITIRGELIGEEANPARPPIVTREEWERMCALLAARRPGRPLGRVHVLSGLVRCGRCGRRVYGFHITGAEPYADGSTRVEYRCRREPGLPGCGRNSIDGQAAEAAVANAMERRLADPRRAAVMAERFAVTVSARATLTAEIVRLNEEADALSDKTAAWGVDRVDRQMAPLLARIDELTGQLAEMDLPPDPAAIAENAVAAWKRAAESGNIDSMRAMIRAACPDLTLRPAGRRRANGAKIDVTGRFDWDGTGTPSAVSMSIGDSITAVLADHPDGMTTDDLAVAVGAHYSTVRKHLARMVEAGTAVKLTRVSRSGLPLGAFYGPASRG